MGTGWWASTRADRPMNATPPVMVPRTAIPVREVFWWVASVLLLMWPALFNGFPLLYSDSATYIASGHSLETPFDRPLTYGILLRLFSVNGLSAWLPVAVQALFTALAIHAVTLRLAPGTRAPLSFLPILFLALFTGLPWVVSHYMADIASPWLVLIALLILLPGGGRTQRSLLYVAYFVCAAMHLGHLVMMLTLLGLLLVLRGPVSVLTGVSYPLQRLGAMALLSLLTIGIMGSAMAKSRNIFFLGALVEHGVVKAYLDAHCGEKDYRLCAHRETLPEKAYEFVWNGSSPLALEGGWREMDREAGAIIRGSLTEPRFLLMHIRVSLEASWDQLLRFAVGDGAGHFGPGSRVHDAIAAHMPGALRQHEQSRQYGRTLDGLYRWVDPMHAAAMAISLLMLVVAAATGRLHATLSFGVAFLLVAVLLHAWVSGTFAGAIDRLGCRMAWLVPAAAIWAWWPIGGVRTTR